MNTLHLQYIIEIERTRSISQAAENLFIGQPNLSRILHDLEEGVGFRIFERTSRGVRPTERGSKFLQHARGILREMEYIDALGPRHVVTDRLRVCLPRSAAMLDATAQYIASLDARGSLDAQIRECHARRAIQMLTAGEAEIAVIRFRLEYREFFEEQAAENDFAFQILRRFKYDLLMPKDHPLASRAVIHTADLEEYPEIVHGDAQRPRSKPEEAERRRIYTVDRQAQFSMLSTIWGAYMWIGQVPEQYLERWGLIQRECVDNPSTYYDALVYNPQYTMTEIEAGFMQHIIRENQK